MTYPPPLTGAELFAYMVELLCRAVAASSAARTPYGTMRVPLPDQRIGRFHRWLRRLGVRFAALATLAREGRVPRPRAPRPVTARPVTPRPGAVEGARARPEGLPRGFGWLLRLVPETAVGAAQINMLLAEPEMAGLLASAPGLGRILRPLCRALGVEAPGMLAAPARERTPAARRPGAQRIVLRRDDSRGGPPAGGPNAAPAARCSPGRDTRERRAAGSTRIASQ